MKRLNVVWMLGAGFVLGALLALFDHRTDIVHGYDPGWIAAFVLMSGVAGMLLAAFTRFAYEKYRRRD